MKAKMNNQNMENIKSDNTFTFVISNELTGQRIISACRLNLENVQTITAHDIFRLNSYWKNRDLLYNLVKTYAALTGWKPTL